MPACRAGFILISEFRNAVTPALSIPGVGLLAFASVSPEDRPYDLADALDVAIDEAAGSVYLQAALRDLRGHLARVRRSAHSNADRLTRATSEHVLIVDAILAQDEALAASATSVHLHNSLANILASLPTEAAR